MTFGYFSLKLSPSAVTNFCIEVDPFNEILPLKSPSLDFVDVLPPPHPASVNAISIATNIETTFFIEYSSLSLLDTYILGYVQLCKNPIYVLIQ